MAILPRSLRLALLACLLLAHDANAQETECNIRQDELGRAERVEEGGAELILLHDPFEVRCTDGAELRANSGRLNQTTRELYLLGNVFFQDSLQTLTSREATYNAGTARLWARGNVVYVDRREGSTLRGPELEYLRATEDRPVSHMTATQRPTLTMVVAEEGEDTEPLELIADRVEMEGEDDLTAIGDVVITREDLRATSARADYNSTSEDLRLRGDAVIVSGEFELRGDEVDARLIQGVLDFLESRTNASLAGEDLRVTGENVRLRFREDLLERVIALASPEAEGRRAAARSASFLIEADSLDAVLVEQQLEEVYAIGSAYGETFDTTAVVEPSTVAGPPANDADVLERDWIRGDTIIGYFAAAETPDAAPDTALVDQEPDPTGIGQIPPDAAPGPEDELLAGVEDQAPERSVELTRLVARGSAQSLYRVASEGGTGDERRNVNFLVGREIVLDVADGELEVARVEGLQYGVYLEAEAPPADEPEPNDDELEPTAPEPGDA